MQVAGQCRHCGHGLMRATVIDYTTKPHTVLVDLGWGDDDTTRLALLWFARKMGHFVEGDGHVRGAIRGESHLLYTVDEATPCPRCHS